LPNYSVWRMPQLPLLPAFAPRHAQMYASALAGPLLIETAVMRLDQNRQTAALPVTRWAINVITAITNNKWIKPVVT